MSLKKKIVDSLSLYLCRYKNVQNFFAVKNSEINTDGISPERKFFDIDNLKDFNCLCGEYNFTVPDADVKERFDNGDRFCMTAENGIYGGKLIFNKINQCDENGFSEEEYSVISPENIETGMSKPVQGIHTYARTDKIEIVDIKYKRINLKRLYWILKKKAGI